MSEGEGEGEGEREGGAHELGRERGEQGGVMVRGRLHRCEPWVSPMLERSQAVMVGNDVAQVKTFEAQYAKVAWNEGEVDAIDFEPLDYA